MKSKYAEFAAQSEAVRNGTDSRAAMLQRVDDLLKQAVDAKDWEKIRKLEAEKKQLLQQSVISESDRMRVMSPSQKLRYSWMRGKSAEDIRAAQDMIDLLDLVRKKFSLLPDDSPEFDRIISGVYLMAEKQGCSEEALDRLYNLLREVESAEMRSRKNKR